MNKNWSGIIFFGCFSIIVILGGILPNLPNSWTDNFPKWLRNVSIFCGIIFLLIVLGNCFSELNELFNKKKNPDID